MLKRKSIIEAIVSLYAFLFVYTAISKYSDLRMFRFSLNDSPLLKDYTNFISIGIPALELLIVVLLIVPKTRLIGLYSAGLLMTLFTGYLIYMVNTTPKLPCSCGGVLSQLTWQAHIWFNLFFVALAGLGIWLKRKMDFSSPARNENSNLSLNT